MIGEGYKTNFETPRKAVKNNDACILECKDKKTGKPVIALCAVSFVPETKEYVLAPLAKLFDGNPYEELIPQIESRRRISS